MTSAAISESELPATPWWLILIEGMALTLLGILFLSKPGMAVEITVQLLGLYWLIAGIVKIVGIFIDATQWGWKLVVGIIGIIAGILVIQHPVWSSAILVNTLILVLGLISIFMGIVSIILAFQGAGWGTGLLGSLSIILGLVLIANKWWFTFSLPVTLGILFIIGGVVAIYWAIKVRIEQTIAPVGLAEPVETGAQEDQSEGSEQAPDDRAQAEAGVGGETPVAIEPIEDKALEDAPLTGGLEASALHGKLEAVQGIGPKYAQRLNEAGIDTPGALLEKCSTPLGRKLLSDQTGISAKLILTWANHADLYRVSGVAGQYGELLEAAGVDTVPELAQRDPHNLHKTMEELNRTKQLVRRLPTESQVVSWVAQAGDLPRIIQY